jgi:hypothetical protein
MLFKGLVVVNCEHSDSRNEWNGDRKSIRKFVPQQFSLPAHRRIWNESSIQVWESWRRTLNGRCLKVWNAHLQSKSARELGKDLSTDSSIKFLINRPDLFLCTLKADGRRGRANICLIWQWVMSGQLPVFVSTFLTVSPASGTSGLWGNAKFSLWIIEVPIFVFHYGIEHVLNSSPDAAIVTFPTSKYASFFWACLWFLRKCWFREICETYLYVILRENEREEVNARVGSFRFWLKE